MHIDVETLEVHRPVAGVQVRQEDDRSATFSDFVDDSSSYSFRFFLRSKQIDVGVTCRKVTNALRLCELIGSLALAWTSVLGSEVKLEMSGPPARGTHTTETA